MVGRQEHPPLESDDGYARAYDPNVWSRGQSRSDFASQYDIPFLEVRAHIEYMRPAPEITGVEAWVPCFATSPGAVKWTVTYRAQVQMSANDVEAFIDSRLDPGTLGIYTRT